MDEVFFDVHLAVRGFKDATFVALVQYESQSQYVPGVVQLRDPRCAELNH